jgi:hypothetical protein
VEIIDYLRVARRRLWLLVAVPVLAAGAAAALVLLAPTRYAATAYVAAPALVGGDSQYSGNQAANQFVAAFGAAVTAPTVLAEVSAATGVDVEALRDGLTVTQVGASSQLEVSYQSTDRAVVAPVLGATTEHALSFLFSSQVEIATGEVESASADVTAATRAISDWEKANKVSQPDRVYQAALSELASLRQQRLQMQAVGNTRGADAAADAIADAQRTLDEIGPKLPDYQALLAQRDAATSALAQARGRLQAARAQAQAADPAKVTSVGPVREVDRMRLLARTALPVAGAGLVVAVLLVALLELLSRGRGAAGAGPASAPGSAPPSAAGPASAQPEPTGPADGVGVPATVGAGGVGPDARTAGDGPDPGAAGDRS